jgi:predicted RNase H-like nuclease (RuvC/YqgF family)
MGKRKDIRMTMERKVSSIEASFSMESLKFDDECRKRVKEVLADEVTVSDAIEELDKKYRVSTHENL